MNDRQVTHSDCPALAEFVLQVGGVGSVELPERGLLQPRATHCDDSRRGDQLVDASVAQDHRAVVGMLVCSSDARLRRSAQRSSCRAHRGWETGFAVRLHWRRSCPHSIGGGIVRVLTVRQPWAWAIIHGGKDIENRSRALGPYRGPVAIHAAAQVDPDPTERDSWVTMADALMLAPDAYSDMPCSVIIGVVDLIDVHEDDSAQCYYCSGWADCGWHHVLANSRPLSEPIPFRGALGLRRLDEAMVHRIEAAIA